MPNRLFVLLTLCTTTALFTVVFSFIYNEINKERLKYSDTYKSAIVENSYENIIGVKFSKTLK